MISVADVNVIFAALVANHVHHSSAWAWWMARPDDSVALCLLTRLGILRLLTNTKAMNGSPLSPEGALSAWDQFQADSRTFWSEPNNDAIEPLLRKFVSGRQPSPNLWSDAWLAAHAESQGWGLTSYDRDFRSFHLTTFELLVP